MIDCIKCFFASLSQPFQHKIRCPFERESDQSGMLVEKNPPETILE